MRILERLPRENNHDYALRVIKENIINLNLAPGSQISENELALELGISRTPVREALQELSNVKIVKIYPQKKGIISLVDYSMVEETQFIRRLLECAVIRLVCELATPDDIDCLLENVRLQNFYLENQDTEKIMELDNKFHNLFFVIAKKPQSYILMNMISIHFDRVRSMALTSVKDLKIVQDHADLIDAIIHQDPDQAEQLMKLHLDRYKIDAAAIRSKYPQYMASSD